MRVLNDYILIEPDKGNEKSESGLIVGKKPGDKTEARAVKGTVVSLGKNALGKDDEKVKVGMHVAVNWLDTVPVDIGGKDFICVKIKDLMVEL